MQVLVNIGQLATCPADHPQSDAGLINNAALVVENERVAWVGPQSDLPSQYSNAPQHDCNGGLVTPGLIDCHTHLCFGGWRADEFEMRLAGKTYQEIAAAGGGIVNTVRATREASSEDLTAKARQALDGMLALGVTTVECKSGYGLEHHQELRQLGIYATLENDHEIDLVPTYLGAHVIPPERADDREEYIDEICDRTLPEIADLQLAEFCDAFVEQGAYSLEEGRRILATAKDLGLGVKLHADQLSDGGGAALAAELGAVSAEHLEYASEAGIAAMAQAGVVCVSLPLASLYLRESFIDARRWMNAGVRVAVATDFNPGSAPSYDIHLALLLACAQQQMTPEEALMGATAIAAKAIARSGEIGSLTIGARADIALFSAPSVNQWLYHFRPGSCHAVIKAGQWIALPNQP